MSLSRILSFTVALAVTVASTPLLAHHGWSSYHEDKPLTVEGVITASTYGNPHGTAKLQADGKTWDVVSPLAHLQYFNEASLSKLLTSCGFEALERIQHPELPRELTPKWMRLMRRLGGDESGELAMLARRPVELPQPKGKV